MLDAESILEAKADETRLQVITIHAGTRPDYIFQNTGNTGYRS